MNGYFRLLNRLEVKKEKYETLGELNKKLNEKYKEWGYEKTNIIDNYEAVIYGEREVTDEMISEVIEQRKILKLVIGNH